MRSAWKLSCICPDEHRIAPENEASVLPSYYFAIVINFVIVLPVKPVKSVMRASRIFLYFRWEI